MVFLGTKLYKIEYMTSFENDYQYKACLFFNGMIY